MENTVDFSSSDLGLDQLVFCTQEGINSMSQLRAVQQFVNNQQLHTLLASGCYFFPLGEQDVFPNVIDFSTNYVGRITGTSDGNDVFEPLD